MKILRFLWFGIWLLLLWWDSQVADRLFHSIIDLLDPRALKGMCSTQSDS